MGATCTKGAGAVPETKSRRDHHDMESSIGMETALISETGTKGAPNMSRITKPGKSDIEHKDVEENGSDFLCDTNWNDDHSSSKYIVQWGNHSVLTKNHRYSSKALAGQPSENLLQFRSDPNSNFWLPSNVQIIEDRLHLVLYNNPDLAPTVHDVDDGTISRVWCCAEAAIASVPLLQYGALSVDVECYGHSLSAQTRSKWTSFAHNRNVVFRIFTYRHNVVHSAVTKVEHNPFGEIDLFQAVSSISNGSSPQSEDTNNAQFAVHKRKVKGNVRRIAVNFEELETLNVTIKWRENRIGWTLKDVERDRVIAEWEYTKWEYIPVPSDELFLHFNLWARGQPDDGQLRHVAVSNFVYTPISEYTE